MKYPIPTLTIYQDTAGLWRWRLCAVNGRVVADSGEGYSTKRKAKYAADQLANFVLRAEIVYETSTSTN